MSKKDHFPLRVSRAIATSDEYAELTDRERVVYWTAASLSFDTLTYKKLARLMNSKIEKAVERLVVQGFLEVDGEQITLSERWAFVDLSTEKVKACRERKKAAKAAQDASPAPVAPTPHPATKKPAAPAPVAPQPVAAVPAPIEKPFPTFPPAENFEDALPYTDDWDSDESLQDVSIDLAGFAESLSDSFFEATPAPIQEAAVVAIEQPASERATAAVPSKAARKRAAATAQADEVEGIALPSYLPRDIWLSFIEHRRFIKAPLNLTAAKLILTEAAKLHADQHDVVLAFNKTIASGRWLSINAPERRGGPADKASAQNAERRRTGGVAL
jgi:hypothetical protein